MNIAKIWSALTQQNKGVEFVADGPWEGSNEQASREELGHVAGRVLVTGVDIENLDTEIERTRDLLAKVVQPAIDPDLVHIRQKLSQ